MNIKILDCTLRDGGYINDWNFSDQHIREISNALDKSNVDIIEYGYLDNRKGKSSNSTLFDCTHSVDLMIPLDSSAQKVVMINLGDFDINNLSQKNKTKIDGIRLAFHKRDLRKALKLSKCIYDLGYKLFFQPMVTKNYDDVEFLSMIKEVNKLKIHAFYIVDSFGAMSLKEFQRYMILADANLNADIVLGYHSHNNMQLAFSNAVNMCGANINRDIIVDASIYGVGRGAGNLNTELIADYLNKSFEKKYAILPLLEVIDEFLTSLMKETPWGFSPAQYLSASLNCHPNYATYLVNKNTKHIVGIKKILERLPLDKRSSFDKKIIEKLYIDSILESKSSISGHWPIFNNKKIILLASGKSVNQYLSVIDEKVKSGEYIIIALNHNPNIDCDYYFFSNQKRFDEFKLSLQMEKIVITDNILSDLDIQTVLDFKKLVFVQNKLVTNVAIVAINYLIANLVQKVEIAGLDGYIANIVNYNYEETSIITDCKELDDQNNIIQKSLLDLSKQIDIVFLTPSIFEV